MRKLSYIRIALLIICCLFTTPFCFASLELAVDDHIPEKLTYSEWVKEERNIWRLHHYPAVWVSVSIDEFTYDPPQKVLPISMVVFLLGTITQQEVAVILPTYAWKYSNRQKPAMQRFCHMRSRSIQQPP